ncbi:MAG: DUF4169 family protein [Rhodobacteraceae bacterium]|nr:DUF4169 family protein [Paracoccaceae bacterium]
MSEPVNLNRFRKAKARAEKKARAEENVVKHGRSKSAKVRDRAQVNKAKRDLDGKRREE